MTQITINMKPDSENLTARESLDLIAAMIQEAKGNMQRNNFFFLLWGWVVMGANLGIYILDKLDYTHPYAIWMITIPAWIYTLYRVPLRTKEPNAPSSNSTGSADGSGSVSVLPSSHLSFSDIR